LIFVLHSNAHALTVVDNKIFTLFDRLYHLPIFLTSPPKQFLPLQNVNKLVKSNKV
jgi:hypothetical protein